jgi:hypothetical protein
MSLTAIRHSNPNLEIKFRDESLVIRKYKDERQKNEEVCAIELITWTTDLHSMTPKGL